MRRGHEGQLALAGGEQAVEQVSGHPLHAAPGAAGGVGVAQKGDVQYDFGFHVRTLVE
jgi:hypothetical protein